MSDPMMRAPEPAGASSLFDSTSRRAGLVAALASGSRRARILQLLQEHGSLALFEVAAMMEVHEHQISGRFTELAADGLIERTGQRRRRPETGCEAELWRIREQASRSLQIPDTFGYPLSLSIDGELYDQAAVSAGDRPGVPYVRRTDSGGLAVRVYVQLIECPRCGHPLFLTQEQGRKTARCNRSSCGATWHPASCTSPGKSPLLALVHR